MHSFIEDDILSSLSHSLKSNRSKQSGIEGYILVTNRLLRVPKTPLLQKGSLLLPKSAFIVFPLSLILQTLRWPMVLSKSPSAHLVKSRLWICILSSAMIIHHFSVSLMLCTLLCRQNSLKSRSLIHTYILRRSLDASLLPCPRLLCWLKVWLTPSV